MAENLAEKLAKEANRLGISLSEQQQAKLLDFLALLIKWNRTYNLIGKAPEAILLARHIVDSLALVGQAQGPRILDVGSGAGLPGVVLAICRPDWQVVLCEPREKRVLFLSHCQRALGLSNIQIQQSRIEELLPQGDAQFQTITCRAFTSLGEFLKLSQHCLAADGVFVAMKGANADEEWRQVEEMGGFELAEKRTYSLGAGEGERVLMIVKVG